MGFWGVVGTVILTDIVLVVLFIAGYRFFSGINWDQ